MIRISAAADLNNVDCAISGTTAIAIVEQRILWNIGGGYCGVAHCSTAPTNAIYIFDIQFSIKSAINVSDVEIALFKRGDGGEIPDAYWFILGKRAIAANGECHLNSATMVDLNGNDKCDLRIILHPTDDTLPCSAVIDGLDIHTAWSISFVSDL